MAVIGEYEAQVLAEYALMAQHLEQIAMQTQRLSDAQPHLLELMRPLERKMGRVFTLFKASMWAVLVNRENQQQEG